MLVDPPDRSASTSLAAVSGSWRLSGSTSCTSSSNATTPTRSSGPARRNSWAVAAVTAASGAPAIEPLRSSATTTSSGGRCSGVAGGAASSSSTCTTSSTSTVTRVRSNLSVGFTATPCEGGRRGNAAAVAWRDGWGQRWQLGDS